MTTFEMTVHELYKRGISTHNLDKTWDVVLLSAHSNEGEVEGHTMTSSEYAQ